MMVERDRPADADDIEITQEMMDAGLLVYR